jgi:hypothetical protein
MARMVVSRISLPRYSPIRPAIQVVGLDYHSGSSRRAHTMSGWKWQAGLWLVLALGLAASCTASRRLKHQREDRDSSVAGPRVPRAGSGGSAGRAVEAEAGEAGAGAAGAAGSTSATTLERDGADVVVTDFYRRCAQDLHCTLVGTSCNGCCGRDAINSALVETYERESIAACDDFEGPVCRCMPEDLVARCAEGRCRAFARVAERDCFSPEQNAGRALEPGEQGCPCAVEGLSACSDGNALACVLDSATKELEWTALAGGMCETSPECAAVSRRPTADACFGEYLRCNRREDGTFCGDQCHGPLDCSAISCADYEPPTPTTVSCDPTGGPWEGLCGGAGELRYRASRGTTGETRYWDAASGELLAVRISSDTQSFCNESEFDMVLGDTTVLQRCSVVTADHTDLCSSPLLP